MFNIKLIDINGDRCVVDFNTSVDTLAEAEVIAKGEVGGHIGTNDIDLIHDTDLIYEVISGGCSVGLVAIEVL